MNKEGILKTKEEWASGYDKTWADVLKDFEYGMGVTKLYTHDEVLDFIADQYATSQTEPLKKEIEELKKNTLLSLFEDFVEWASKQFPNSTMESSLIGLDREISEVILAKADYTVIDCEENRTNLGIEYVDCIMYLIDSMKRAGFEISELPSLFAQKLEINKKREWKQNKDKSYSHITPPKH